MLVLHSVVDPFYLDTLCQGLYCDFVEMAVMDYDDNDVVKEYDHDYSFLYMLISCLEVQDSFGMGVL